jgi:hypothetical protein
MKQVLIGGAYFNRGSFDNSKLIDYSMNGVMQKSSLNRQLLEK